MDLTVTVYVLSAFTILGTILLPIIGVVISIMRAGPPPDVKDSEDTAS